MERKWPKFQWKNWQNSEPGKAQKETYKWP